jgi:hypothetical protein
LGPGVVGIKRVWQNKIAKSILGKGRARWNNYGWWILGSLV